MYCVYHNKRLCLNMQIYCSNWRQTKKNVYFRGTLDENELQVAIDNLSLTNNGTGHKRVEVTQKVIDRNNTANKTTLL